MKRRMLILLLLLLGMAGPAVGSEALEIYFVDLAGHGYISSDLKGSPLIIYVGSTS